MGFSDLRQELVASVESDLFTTNASRLEPEDIITETEAYFETLTSVESSLDAIELSDASAKVLEEAIAEMESDNFEAAIAKANAVHELILGQPLEVATVEADDEESKKSVIEKIKEFLKKILNYIKEKGKAIWNKIRILVSKIKNIVGAFIGKKLFAKKLDKFIEECKGKKPAREFTEDEVKKIAKEAFIFAKNGVISLDNIPDIMDEVMNNKDYEKLFKDVSILIEKIKRKDFPTPKELETTILRSLRAYRLISLREGKIYGFDKDYNFVVVGKLGEDPDKIKKADVITPEYVERFKKLYSAYAKHAEWLIGLTSKNVEITEGLFKAIEKVSEIVVDVNKAVGSIDDKTLERDEIKKLKESYMKIKQIILNATPKATIIGMENARYLAAPKIGTWLDLSCKVLKEGKKEEDSKKEEPKE